MSLNNPSRITTLGKIKPCSGNRYDDTTLIRIFDPFDRDDSYNNIILYFFDPLTIEESILSSLSEIRGCFTLRTVLICVNKEIDIDKWIKSQIVLPPIIDDFDGAIASNYGVVGKKAVFFYKREKELIFCQISEDHYNFGREDIHKFPERKGDIDQYGCRDI